MRRKIKAQFPHLKWLGHLDIDEFIDGTHVKMGRRLAMQPPDYQCVRILPMENLIQTNMLTLVLSNSNFSNAKSQNASNIENYFPCIW